MTTSKTNVPLVYEEQLAEIRRTAGSQSLRSFKEAVERSKWNSQTLSTARSNDGKTALIMAAWKGCLDNVRYLVEEWHVDLNVYSKAPYAYGKTALFFALTQSRSDVVEYLLFLTPVMVLPKNHSNSFPFPPKVTIVNNKGQSILSLASSHDMPDKIMDRIRQLEILQEGAIEIVTNDNDNDPQKGWWNFRASHSDGLEYGDLDPRFLSRPLREGIDVVTELAINPTTKTTRKNGFARRNPHVASKERERKEQQQKQRQDAKHQQKAAEDCVRLDREAKWEQYWLELQQQQQHQELDHHGLDVDMCDKRATTTIMVAILRLGAKLRRPWIDELTERIQRVCPRDDKYYLNTLLDAAEDEMTKASDGESAKCIGFLDKIRVRIGGDVRQSNDTRVDSNDTTTNVKDGILVQQTQKKKKTGSKTKCPSLDPKLWKAAFQNVQDLSRSILELNHSSILSLSQPPTLVDSLEGLQKLELELEMGLSLSLASSREQHLIAIDTEWYHDARRDCTNGLSTLQIAFHGNDHDEIHTYVVDLMETQKSYRNAARDLIYWILNTGNLLVLGFAIGHDLPLLKAFMGPDSGDGSPISTFLDLQPFLAGILASKSTAKNGACQSSQVKGSSSPGLKTCAAHFSTLLLSKDEQCSDWDQRPLRASQIDYAGLDAAVLLVLLAEGYRQRGADQVQEYCS